MTEYGAVEDLLDEQLAITVSSDGISDGISTGSSGCVSPKYDLSSATEQPGGDDVDSKALHARKLPSRMQSMHEFRELPDKDERSKTKQMRKTGSRFTLGKS